MSQPENIQEVFRRWTPVALMNLPEEVKTPDTFPDYMGTDDNPLPIGHSRGILTVIGYSHDVRYPYVAQCACGNVVTMNHKHLTSTQYHCGCLTQIMRSAYLIRLRIEAMRSWWQQVPMWLDDLDKLREHAKKYKKSIRKTAKYNAMLSHVEYADDPLTFDREIESSGSPDNEDAFLSLVAPSEEYSQFLRDIAEKLTNVYEPWPAIPMANTSAYASYKNELPEFDAATFINFVNYLADAQKKPLKPTSDNGDKQ